MQVNILGAQCYPRHACPLYVPLLMQLHFFDKASQGLKSSYSQRYFISCRKMHIHA
jgi:hypothetical protein